MAFCHRANGLCLAKSARLESTVFMGIGRAPAIKALRHYQSKLRPLENSVQGSDDNDSKFKL